MKAPRLVRASALAILALFAPFVGQSQQPTPAQVQRALSDPGLAAQIRTRIGNSGLSPDQIRSRLRAAGYSENLLDPYMDASGDVSATPGDDVLNAVRFLGLVDDQERAAQSAAPAPPARRDTLPPSRIYGMNIFRRSTTQFEPDLAGPVDPSYKLGPRDVIALILTGGVEMSHTLEVTREGFIVIPQVGQVYVANLTLDQVEDVLFTRLRRVYSGLGRGAGASTNLFVTVARLRTNQVFVVGDVMQPGSYQLSSAGTMLTALYAAGGPSDNGNLRQIQLRRSGKVISELDVYSYLATGNASADARLETGDVVFVPVRGARVEIRGEVVRPSIYEMRPGESLAQLLYLAGGFTAEASRERVVIQRVLPAGQRNEVTAGQVRTAIHVTSEELTANGGASVRLEDGDEVQVFPVTNRVRNRIVVNGAVWVPGSQAFTSGMKLSDAIRLAGGAKPEVKNVQISRLQSDETRRELRTPVRDTLGTPVEDLMLQEDDSITVFGTSDFRPERYVIITGAVRNGGRFPYREGMTLRDLLHYAGGLEDGAFLDRAEIARVPENRVTGTLSVTIAAPMDSTYLLERGLDGKYIGPPGLAASASGAPEIRLQPYDNVLILQQPDFQLNRLVTILGEVVFPGEYTLKTKTERVRDVIRRAGGLTAVAYPTGAVFTRAQGRIGRVGFDLARVMQDSTFRDNIVMMPGDTLYIPPVRSVVDVRGSVHSPIAVAYTPGKDIDYYINAAGGTTYDADRNRAYVQQPNGVVEPFEKRPFLIPDKRPHPLAGAVVVVPARDPNEKKDWTAIAGSVAQVLASIVAIVAIAR